MWSNEGEFYSEEKGISVHKLSESMLHSLQVMTVSFVLGGFKIIHLGTATFDCWVR